MKFNRNTEFFISKSKIHSSQSKNQPLDYKKWVDFVNSHKNEFIWYENTKHGMENLENINKVPDDFKEKVLQSLNRIKCYKEFDKENNYYNINIGFNAKYNWISIGFDRTPKLEDLKIFLEMANHLDALLLKDGEEVIDEKIIKNLS